MGNIIRRGIDAYRKTMKPEQQPQGAPKNPPPQAPPDAGFSKENPADPGGLLKTVKIPVPKREETLRVPRLGSVLPPPEGTDGDSKYRRVAKLLILIGGDQAAKILSELDPQQVEGVSREIASIRGISAAEGEEILCEFRSLFSAPYGFLGASSGGLDTARRILYAAMGPEKGEALLNKAVPESKENSFDFLEEFAPEQVTALLKDETPAASALILSRISSKLSAGALSKMLPASRAEILRRIAHQGDVAPEVLEQVAAGLKEKARRLGGAGGKDVPIDGMGALAAILKQGDYAFGDRLINELESDNPDLGHNLKERLYTLDDVIRMTDRPLTKKLRSMTDREIAVLLKGRGDDFSGKILSCVSARRKAQIIEEGEIIGAVPKRDCDAAAREFLAWFRLSREEGKIILSSDEDVFV